VNLEKTSGPAPLGSPRLPPWALPAGEVVAALGTDGEHGLGGDEARGRLAHHGPNQLKAILRRSGWQILTAQFRSLVVALLAVASVVSFGFGEVPEGLAILAVLGLNAAIGFVTEARAVRSMEALRELGRVPARVRRDGSVVEIPAEELVPGDIVLLEGGDIVSADLRVLRASRLEADESTLTGESVPVEKGAEPLPADVLLADRSNILFKGTSLTRGSGAGVVVATGMATELGRISALVQEADAEPTPLERRLDEFVRRLVWLTLALTALVGITGVIAGRDLLLTIQASIALAVAAVPEGLPVVATLALARGMLRMARRNALVERLSAVETLGSTTVILTDKTGTLTENRMSVARICVAGPEAAPRELRFPEQSEEDGATALVRRALSIGVLCNDASRGRQAHDDGRTGDPLELALLDAAMHVGLEKDVLVDEMPRLREEAFDPAVRMMATFHQLQGGVLVAVKGAPEAVVNACTGVVVADGENRLDDPSKEAWLAVAARLGAEGLRVLALAERFVTTDTAQAYADLTLVGLVALADPPRREVRSSVQRCRNAGMRVVMVTGDHTDTARSIAAEVGLDDDRGRVVSGRELSGAGPISSERRDQLREASVFARITPEQKMDILALHQGAGEVVAMIGDGVNDAPR
jgi:Ca2+-transporting ATPase